MRAPQEAGKRKNQHYEQIEYAPRLEHDVPRLHNVDINRKELRRDDLDVMQFSIQVRYLLGPARRKLLWYQSGGAF